MATIKKFEDLEIWQTARKLNKEVCPILEILQKSKDYKLKEQLDASLGSVMDNIAEGFERDGNREFLQFLAISKGSLGEAKSQLYRAFDRKALNETELNDFQKSVENLRVRSLNSCSILITLTIEAINSKTIKQKTQELRNPETKNVKS